jgi:GMP synthase (glutamine-hydrolysing)
VSRPILVVQHQDDCPPALFGTWIADAGGVLDIRRPYAGDDLPADLDAHGGLIVLGGSMGAEDEDVAPWLESTKDLVRVAIAREVPLLGICLGHQVCAVALGGTLGAGAATTRQDLVEVGWRDEVVDDPLFAARPTPVAHWNNDIVLQVPAGATVLARSPGGDVQVVRLGPVAWGIQAHPEADEQVLDAWAAEDGAPDVGDLPARVGARAALLARQWRPVAEAFGRLASS